VTIEDVTVWFSYRTPVAFMAPGWGRVVRENEWGPTTGRHLNYIDDGYKALRVDGQSFQTLIREALDGRLPAESVLP
jgi:hypothetical protein